MSKLLLVCIVAGSLSLPVEAQPPQTQPLSPEGLHELLQRLSWYPDDARREPEKVKYALKHLEAALQSSEDRSFIPAVRDVVEGYTHRLPEKEVLKILLPVLRKFPGGPIDHSKVPVLCRLLESVSDRFGPKAK